MSILLRVGLALILMPGVWAQTAISAIAAPFDKTVEVSPSQPGRTRRLTSAREIWSRSSRRRSEREICSAIPWV